ncbi:MAG: DUF6382 domain-containing protein, partial [Clostridiales bacterium]|nr:DUF6382 domain-containing protein [Clostridiales bacterium]
MINREIIYDRDVMGSYMKIAASPTAGMDEKLMMKKKLPGTLQMEKNFVDGKGQYWYLISGKQSLDTYCKVRKVDLELMERLVISVCSQLEILEWNLIQTNCLMLDPELIFVANGSREFIFTLYPGNNSRPEVEFQQLMEFLLTKLDHTD